MKFGLSLFLVFVLSKCLVLAGSHVPLRAIYTVSYFWQDVAMSLLLGVPLSYLKSRRAAWVLYWAIVLFTVINIPVSIALSTFLTWTMIQAAGLALADSIAYYVTPANGWRMVSVLLAAALLPRLRFSSSHPGWIFAVAVSLCLVGVLGPYPEKGRGLHRNPGVVLAASLFPRSLRRKAGPGDPRISPVFAPRSAQESARALSGRLREKNVLLVALESTAATYLSLYGAAGEDITPRLTALSRHALLSQWAYAVYPESIKGLFSVLCSFFPGLDTTPEQYETLGVSSLPQELKKARYHTSLFHSGRFDYLGMQSVIQNRGFDVLEDAVQISRKPENSFGMEDERVTARRVLSWIDGIPREEKFFAFFMPIAGHHPYFSPRPKKFAGGSDLLDYRNAVYHSDEALGEIIDGLKRRGRFDDTLIVVYGDHGEAFEQHPGNTVHSLYVFEENVRVPLLFAHPEINEVRMLSPTNLIDLAPTVLDLLALPIPKSFQGRSLLLGEEKMALFFTDYSQLLLGLRDRQWKFIYDYDTQDKQLFDLTQDAEEKVDLSLQHPREAKVYKETLLRWMGTQQARF